MNLGDYILLKDIALFTKTEAEEAIMVLRYFFFKERSPDKKATYLAFIDLLESKLLKVYAVEQIVP